MSHYGFTILRNNTQDLNFKFSQEKTFRSKSGVNYYFGYHSFRKFHNDKIFEEDNELIIGIDGVVLNLSSLKNKHAISDQFQLMKHLYYKRKENFASDFKGEFTGFIFEKKSAFLLFFNNKTATKQCFYSQVESTFIITPSIKNIIDLKNSFNYNSSLDFSACYNMLTFGGMIEDQTLIKGVRKLNAGDYLKLEDEKFSLNKYFDFNNIEYSISDKKQAIEQLDKTFESAVELEYQKDQEYNYRHIATLSGGLDSRFNVMLASRLGYNNETFCFSQSNYLDEKIAKQISDDLYLNFQFIPLDKGEYLQDLAENVELNNGLQFYLSAAHFNFALKKINLKDFGLVHTGLAGDGILGGFLSKGDHPDFYSNKISYKLVDKLENKLSIERKYKNEEVFKLYQRVFNVTNFGAYVVEPHQSYLVSPFLDEDVLITALSIDPKLKKKQVYLDWLIKKHPYTTKYKWEKTGFKPNAKYKTELSRYTNKIKKEFWNLTKQQQKLSMTPEDFWLKSNVENQNFYNNTFHQKIDRIRTNQELFKDLKFVFYQGNINEKAAVLTILEMVDKFNLKI
ncbi:MAG: asparagine synthase-related protein [Bacteroidota bacterium]